MSEIGSSTETADVPRVERGAEASGPAAGRRGRKASSEPRRKRVRVPREGPLDPLQAIEAFARAVERGEPWYPALLLYIDATRFYSVPAIIDSINFEVDIDTGEVVGWTADYSADGAWTKPTYS